MINDVACKNGSKIIKWKMHINLKNHHQGESKGLRKRPKKNYNNNSRSEKHVP
jgi:hypothetical protein